MSTSQCSLCRAEEPSEGFRVGPKCASKLGLRMLAPPQRPPVPCARCNGMKFVRVLPRHYNTYLEHMGNSIIGHRTIGSPLTLTSKPPDMTPGLLKREAIQDAEIFDGLGTVETYVCATCGFVEWYCENPHEIPIGDEYNTQYIDYSSETPYR